MSANGALKLAIVEILRHPDVSLSPPSVLPSLALGLGGDLSPSVLVIGGPLPARDEHELHRRGCVIRSVADLVGGLEAMTESRWDAVAVSPSVETDVDGLRFVRAFKCLPTSALPHGIMALAIRYSAVPFIVLPLPGTSEFAVFRNATDWSLADAATCPIATMILGRSNVS